MTHTALPSIKGQVTLPAKIREKYHITKNTPLVIEDKGKGVIVMTVMQIVEHDAIMNYENEKEFGIHFKHGIDPEVIIKAARDLD